MTQGIVAIKKKGTVILKAVVGCDGYNAGSVAEAIRERYGPRGGQPSIGVPTAQEFYDLCLSHGFGCRDCLVVLSLNEQRWNEPDIIGAAEMEEAGRARYLDTFYVAEFNPRWKYGTADHVKVVSL